jgi:hypothetical protein
MSTTSNPTEVQEDSLKSMEPPVRTYMRQISPAYRPRKYNIPAKEILPPFCASDGNLTLISSDNYEFRLNDRLIRGIS